MIPTNPYKNASRALVAALAALVCTAGNLTFAQNTSTPAATPNDDETISLPKFEITADAVNRYQSQQALSASRVATPIIDIPQTISVIPKELMEDTKGNRMLDTAKYVTPVQESTLPFGGDRYSIRGFMVSAEFVDGTNISGADGYSMSQAPYNIERLEVLKGPNAILVPGGSPGGVINPITKSPMAKNAASVTLDFSPDMGRDIWFDVNRVLTKDGKMAARLIAAYWDSEFYIKDQFRRGFEISPSFSYQISQNHKLTLKADFVLNRETNLGGLQIDPSIGYGGEAKIARGLPRDWQFGNETDSRKRETARATAELLSTLNDHVTSRLNFMVNHVWRRDVGGTSAGLKYLDGTGTLQNIPGSVNPRTGHFEPGIVWNTSAYNNDTTGTVVLTGTNVGVPDPSSWVYTRNNGKVDLEYTEAHLKNDYAAQFQGEWFKSTTIGGVAANVSRVHFQSWAGAARPNVPANNLASITYPAYNYVAIVPGPFGGSGGTDKTGLQKDFQTFIYEKLDLWGDRIQVSGGVSRFFGELSRVDNNGSVAYTLPNTPSGVTIINPDFTVTSNATSFGVLVKPIKQVSLFYSRNTTGASMPGSLQAGNTNPGTPLAVGGQKEFGFKTSFFGGRLNTSFAHFDIAQQNVATTNSEYYRLLSLGDPASVAAANALPPLYLNLKSKGWEFEANYAVTKNLTVLGNVTDLKVRQPVTDARVRGIPDRSYGAYVDYKFLDGALKGFGVNFGIDYKGDVAGENVSGFTVLRGGTPVPIQPSFVVGARTLMNLGFSYKIQHWSLSATIMNLTDEDYILAAGSRSSLVAGTPRTWKSTISYAF
ncbi:MAG: TonB-dependent receptor plug domain-containing protein [Nibricoccus sp.]